MSPMNTRRPPAGPSRAAGETNAADELKLPVVSDAPAILGRKLWRSIEEKEPSAASLEARQDEFPADPGFLSAVDRRGFLQLLGGAAALAGTAACWRPPEEKIYPYTRQPENVPGVPQHYASALLFDGYATGVVVSSYDGRPIKVEGNALHPNSRGRTTVFEQANLNRLYDPNRAKTLSRKAKPVSWRTAASDLAAIVERATADGGSKLRFLVQPTTSPTIASLRDQIRRKLPQAKFYAWSPVSRENPRRGAQAAFGAALDARYDLTKANVIVSLDSDFLIWEPERLRLAREFADRRVPESRMNRLYAVEPTVTVTGLNADHRLRVKPSEVANVGRALAQALNVSELSGSGGAQLDEAKTKWVRAVAEDLQANRGTSVVIAGLRQPPAVHALAHAINSALGNLGQTVTFTRPVTVETDDGIQALRALAEEIKGGRVETLVVDAYNPVFTAPADVDLDAAFKAVPNAVYHAYYVDETASACNWIIPQAHELESWGDARGPDGTTSIIQPLIAPLWNAIPPVNFWAAFVGQGVSAAHDLVKNFWMGKASGAASFENDWRKYLAEGVIPNTAEAPATASFDVGGANAAIGEAPARGEGLELNLVPDYRVYDGRFGNVSWLQELPDPVTKVTWENTATVSPATADRLGLKRDSWVKLTLRDRSVEAPVYVLPGHADEVVTVSLGQGRGQTEEALAARHGFNAYALRFSNAPWFSAGLTLENTGKPYQLGITQDHGSMEGRDMALSAGLQDRERLQEAVRRNREVLTPEQIMQEPVDYRGVQKWGMSIDLSRCIGCNACVIACQAENNIPIVGKDQVIRAREMHWLMIDRYFVGDDVGDPEIIPQPRMCVHCETAPCEYVCPVNATVHSDEGLNDMVYNRCVGTRYCSNNCPYKVRRFNYLHWSKGKTLTEKMMMNPDVTVRARGVMEKCTYCVQRIERARIDSRIENRAIKEGEIVTACQQSCPTDAIVFGDLNDPNARVSKLHANGRRYDLLYDLGTRPRTGHLARIKNYNPALAAAKPGKSTEHH
jgi:MoCo/4Fe-4S cofactor protein with predicted Tat translocation signal